MPTKQKGPSIGLVLTDSRLTLQQPGGADLSVTLTPSAFGGLAYLDNPPLIDRIIEQAKQGPFTDLVLTESSLTLQQSGGAGLTVDLTPLIARKDSRSGADAPASDMPPKKSRLAIWAYDTILAYSHMACLVDGHVDLDGLAREVADQARSMELVLKDEAQQAGSTEPPKSKLAEWVHDTIKNCAHNPDLSTLDDIADEVAKRARNVEGVSADDVSRHLSALWGKLNAMDDKLGRVETDINRARSNEALALADVGKDVVKIDQRLLGIERDKRVGQVPDGVNEVLLSVKHTHASVQSIIHESKQESFTGIPATKPPGAPATYRVTVRNWKTTDTRDLEITPTVDLDVDDDVAAHWTYAAWTAAITDHIMRDEHVVAVHRI